MGIYPRVVAADTVFYWDHVLQRLPRGLVLDVAPGSALEAAIGADRLSPLAAHSDVPVKPQGTPRPVAASNESYASEGGGGAVDTPTAGGGGGEAPGPQGGPASGPEVEIEAVASRTVGEPEPAAPARKPAARRPSPAAKTTRPKSGGSNGG
jgi:hypothetical protein